EVGGERMPEAVRVRCEAPHRRRIEPPPAHGDEERPLARAGEAGSRLAELARDPVAGLLAEGDDAFLRALSAPHVDTLLLEVDVAEVEAHRLGAAQPRRVHEIEQ